jgi:nitroimidazol reductase NimA-like FMN-containing flavoprotein (pyridoxamine 5'-phosphate oxidase superfamily)
MAGFLTWRKVDLPLQAGRSIWLSTTRPEGRPHAVPVWYVWDRGAIYFTTRRDMQKAKNLAQQPWVVVHAGDGDDVIILQGPAEVVADREELARVDALHAAKYVDPHSGTRDTIFHEGVDLYRVDVRHVMAWEYGVVATRTDWRFPDARAEGDVAGR